MNRKICNYNLIILILVFLFTSCSNTKAPNPYYSGSCDLTVKTSPELRGFRLGMSVDEIIAKYPQIQIKPTKQSCCKTIYVNQQENNVGIDLDGVESILISLTDDHISKFAVVYLKSPHLTEKEDFYRQMEKSLGIRMLLGKAECFDFRIETAFDKDDSSSLIVFEDLYVPEVLYNRERDEMRKIERQKQSEQENRANSFKP